MKKDNNSIFCLTSAASEFQNYRALWIDQNSKSFEIFPTYLIIWSNIALSEGSC